jgi:hypothetical protein
VTNLRSIEIPRNTIGLSEGLWIRWPELNTFLNENDYREVSDLIQNTLDRDPIEQREVTIRR